MRTRNVHERFIGVRPETLAAHLDSVGSRRDRLWPRDRWPAMTLDRPVSEWRAGQVSVPRGGHGPIRYRLESYSPGQRLAFAFEQEGLSQGMVGEHVLEMKPCDGGVLARHTIDVDLRGRARILWPLIIRPLHDALIEDALDNFERAGGAVPAARSYSAYVRVLRRALGLGARRAVHRSRKSA